MGQGSGKGLWDWTNSQDDGKLFPQPGTGVSLSCLLELSENLTLRSSILYAFASAGQKVGNKEYKYYQHSFETPILLMGTPPIGSERLSFGAGPTVIFLPFTAGRSENSGSYEKVSPQRRGLIGIRAGADYLIPLPSSKDLIASLHFTHPFTSPGYKWKEGGSGNIRINRLDFSLGVLWNFNKESS